MPLSRRKPRKVIKIREAAEAIGCSSESIRTGAVGDFTLFKLNPEKQTSPLLMYQAELDVYLDRRDRLAGF